MDDILILLTQSQAENLIEFFEIAFIPLVRDTPDIDNLDYLVDMCEIYKQLKHQYDIAKGRGLSLEQCVPEDDIIDVKVRETEESADEFAHPVVQWCLKNAEHGATAKFYTYKCVYENSFGVALDQANALEASRVVLNALTRSVCMKLYEHGIVISVREKNGNEGRGIRITKVNGMDAKEEKRDG